MAERLIELRREPPGWDSYGGQSLRDEALTQFLFFYMSYEDAMQSKPSLSLTPTGGIHAMWVSTDAELEISFEGDSASVLYEDLVSHDELSGSIEEFTARIMKWLWRSSMAV